MFLNVKQTKMKMCDETPFKHFKDLLLIGWHLRRSRFHIIILLLVLSPIELKLIFCFLDSRQAN